MPCDYELLPHHEIQSLQPYIAGKSIESVIREEGITDVIKLASNENPLGCSPLVHEALNRLTLEEMSRYLCPIEDPLNHKIADKLNLEPENISLGNGSDVFPPLLQNCFALHLKKHIIIPDYTFINYRINAAVLGIPVVNTPVYEDYQVNIDAIIATCNDYTALIFIANPNNPTGVLLPQTEIKRLLNAIPPTTIVVIDEAYDEFVYDAEKIGADVLINGYPNLVILRTFSKAYGLAGLRLGYAISNPTIAKLLKRIQLPFTISKTALVAGAAALEDSAFLQKTIENNIAGKKQLQTGLDNLGIRYLHSAGNFITFNYEQHTMPLYKALLSKGVIVRPLSAYGLDHFLRVTIGLPAQNSRFLDQLKELHHA